MTATVKKAIAALGSFLLGAAAITGIAAATTTPAAAAVPAYDHIVVVIDENTAYESVNGSSSAPYLNSLGNAGAKMTQSFAVTHPSEPNYLALYAGSTFGIADDNCRTTLSGPSLGTQLTGAGKTFIGYAENLDADGSTTCVTADSQYKSKHAPWAEMTGNAQFGHKYSEFPTDFTQLPNVSFVIPNMCDDMHDCSITTGDTWLKNNLDAYAQWAKTHNSLLITTFDEDDDAHGNHIFTTLTGQGVTPGAYSQALDHYGVLGLIEDSMGMPRIASAVGKPAVTAPFTASTAAATPTPTTSTATATPPPTATATATTTASPSPTSTMQPVGVTVSGPLVFDDEFNGSALDGSKWANSWFGGGTMNNVSTPSSNVSVSNGNLVLTLSDSTHGALVSTNPNGGASPGFTFTSGYTEARINFPGDANCNLYNWPAWWTDGQSWPGNGEIDIAEILSGKMTSNYHSSPSNFGSGTIPGCWTGWHTYGVDRQAGKNTIYMDGRAVWSYTPADSSAPQYLILNVGDGGTHVYGAASQVQVDYVRAWSGTASASAVATPAATATASPSPTATATAAPTLTPTPTPTASSTPTATATSAPTQTPSTTGKVSLAGTPTLYENASSTSAVIPYPAGIQAGEVLLAQVSHSNVTAPTAPPSDSGWNLYKAQDGETAISESVWYKVATGTETGSVTFPTSSTAGRVTGSMERWTGVDTSNIFDTPGVGANSPVATTFKMPSITTATANAELVHTITLNAATAADINTPAGVTKVSGTTGSGRRQFVGHETVATPGTAGGETWTETSTTTLQWAGITVALRPLVAASPSPTTTVTATPTPTATASPTSLPTATAPATATPTPTATAAPTATADPTSSPSATATPTPTSGAVTLALGPDGKYTCTVSVGAYTDLPCTLTVK
jgi:hypothetical protein